MITIIPAIDLISGSAVRLTQGDFARKQAYSADPLTIAQRYEAAGVRRLHLVDLDGARQKQVVNQAVLQRIADKTNLRIDFGGGIHSRDDLQKAFDHGAAQVTLGSIAVKEPETAGTWLQEYGPDRLILGADFRGDTIAIHAWQEQTALTLSAFVSRFSEMGFREMICTDIARDGNFSGPALQRYIVLKTEFPHMRLIASGGVAGIDDVRRLDAAGIDGVIIGKALLEGRITLEELEPFLC